MQGIGVILSPGVRKVWRANSFYLEQVDPGSTDHRRGSISQLVIARREVDETSNSTEATLTVLARIPRWCFIQYPLELDAAGTAPADAEFGVPAQTAEPDPTAPLRPSTRTKDNLPAAPAPQE